MVSSRVVFILLFLYHLVRIGLWNPSKTILRIGHHKEYDFIIVGAGSAGCVLANRLSEDPNVTVLLIESGGMDSHHHIHVPMGCVELQRTAVDWQFETVPQMHSSFALRKQRSKWPRGKVLGGTSSINAMLYIRGNSIDYDRWEQIYGGDGWNWKNVLPYFKKAENWRGSKGDLNYHGTDGPLTVDEARFITSGANWFISAAKEIGFNESDPNGEKQEGASYLQFTIEDGERCSTAKAYLHPARYRENLFLLLNSHVTNVEMEGDKAVGVRLRDEKTNEERVVRARKEVILSAGSIGSPHILLQTGIGPADHLQDAGIQVIQDLPVGQNLEDHLLLPMAFLTPDIPKNSGLTITKEYGKSFASTLQYMFFTEGMLAISPIEAQIVFRTDRAKDKRPDIQLLYVGGPPNFRAAGDFNLIPLLAKTFFGPQVEHIDSSASGFLLTPTLLRPKSKGDIKLQLQWPWLPPHISPNYLQDPEDVEVLLKSVRFVQKLLNTSVYSNISIHCPILDARSPYPTDSDDFWRWYIRQTAVTEYHPVGTCRMGQHTDKEAVVDPHLRVRGIKNLRVVDASVIPEITSGNTNAPVIMVAERASDLIKNDHQMNY